MFFTFLFFFLIFFFFVLTYFTVKFFGDEEEAEGRWSHSDEYRFHALLDRLS